MNLLITIFIHGEFAVELWILVHWKVSVSPMPCNMLLQEEMELSEKRKERLKALYTGATQFESTDGHPGPATPSHLVNPLIQSPASPPAAEKSPQAPRFDYYTDPMSAYSGTKRSSSSGHHQPDNFSSPLHSSTPLTHLPAPSSAGPRTYVASTASQNQVNYSPHGWSYESPLPGPPQYAPWRSPVNMVGPLSGHSPVGMPGIQDRSGGTSGYGLPHGASRGSFSSPGFGRGASLRTYPGRGSPSTNSGRGSPFNLGRGSPFNLVRGSNWRLGNYRSPHSGRGNGGRGNSACEKPELFFSKLMIVDPWDELEPVVGCILDTVSLQKSPDLGSWLPKSLMTKKPKVSEAISAPKSGPSLAEYIALSLEEALNDETT